MWSVTVLRTVKRDVFSLSDWGQERYEAILETDPTFFHRQRRYARHHLLARSRRSTQVRTLRTNLAIKRMSECHNI